MKTKSLLFSCFLAVILTFSASSAFAQCVAGFTASVNGGTVTFTNTSTASGIPFCTWNFGDSSPAAYSSYGGVTHAYNTAGTFNVCVTVTDSLNQNCTNTFCNSVTVNVGCNNLSVSATPTAASACAACDGSVASSVTGGTAPYSYLWSNATTTASLINLCTGSYSLTVVDANGCTTSTNANVMCPDSCVAAFAAYMSGNTVYLSNTSNDTMGNASFQWSFGDFSSSTAANPGSHTYAATGTYTIMLIMNNFISNCTDTAFATVTATGPNSPCSVNFTMVQDSFNLLQWYAYTTVTGAAPFTYLWDFGDNSSSTLQYPTHTYAAPGQYTICLTITDANNCSSMYCDSSSVQRSSASLQMQSFAAIDPATTSIHEQEGFAGRTWPNPTADLINVSFNTNVNGVILVTDLTGKTISEQKINGRTTTIDLSTLPVGIYHLTLSSESVKWNEKIVIIR